MLTVLLLVLQICFVHVHILTEHHHLDGIHFAATAGVSHDDGHHEEHDRDTHPPHSASDHLLQMVAKHRTSFLAVVALPPESSIALIRPDTEFVRIDFAGGIPPSEAPPDPLQPRAPPLA